MADRSPITNLLLLGVLTSILLISGSLQCAFNCLSATEADHGWTQRVDQCHLQPAAIEVVFSGPNKACHLEQQSHGRMGDPSLISLRDMPTLLVCSQRQLLPQVRTGELFITPEPSPPVLLASYTPPAPEAYAQLRALRTTVLLN